MLVKHAVWVNYRLRRMRWCIEEYCKLLGSTDRERIKAQRWALTFLRRTLWFESARSAFHARTAADLGRALDPDRYVLKDEKDGYVRDKRMERLALAKQGIPLRYLNRTACEKPEAATHYPDVLFRALDTTYPIGDRADALFRQMSWPVQHAIFGPDGRHRRKQGTCRMLARHANTEGVAAMLILFRESYEKGPSKRCLELGMKLYFMTLTWCARHPIREALWEIAFYLALHIFPLAESEELCLDVHWADFSQEAECLAFHVFQLNRFPLEMRNNVHDGPSPDWEKFEEGDWGQDYKWGLGPLLALRNAATLSPQGRSTVIFCRVMKTWGWRSLRLFEQERFPPDAVIEIATKDSLTLADLDSIETEREWGKEGWPIWTRSPIKLRQERRAKKLKGSARRAGSTKRADQLENIGEAYSSWIRGTSVDSAR